MKFQEEVGWCLIRKCPKLMRPFIKMRYRFSGQEGYSRHGMKLFTKMELSEIKVGQMFRSGPDLSKILSIDSNLINILTWNFYYVQTKSYAEGGKPEKVIEKTVFTLNICKKYQSHIENRLLEKTPSEYGFYFNWGTGKFDIQIGESNEI